MKNISVLILISFYLLSCGGEKTNEQDPEEKNPLDHTTLSAAQLKNAGIVVDKLKQKKLSSILRLNGKIEAPPQNMVSISAPLGGYLKSTLLLPGMKIKKGTVIAVMEDQQYISLQQDYLIASAKLIYNEREYARQSELNQSKASSDKVFQLTETEYTTQKILVASLREKLKLISIDPDKLNERTLSRAVNVYSPINGYVSKIYVNVGKYVNPSDVLFELVNPDDIHLALTVFEKDIDQLHIGQKLKAFTNNAQKIYPCEIILVGKNLSSERSLEVHCHFMNYDHSLIPGMYMNAELAVETKEVYAVNENALVNYDGKNYVFVQLGVGSFAMVQVEPGEKENGFIEIKNPAKLADKNIVVAGAYNLLMNLKNKGE